MNDLSLIHAVDSMVKDTLNQYAHIGFIPIFAAGVRDDFRIAYAHPMGILMTTTIETHSMNSMLYFNWKPNDPDQFRPPNEGLYIPLTQSAEIVDGVYYMVVRGCQRVRERIPFLENNGSFCNPWIRSPMPRSPVANQFLLTGIPEWVTRMITVGA
jgi:hypothetical protein